MIEKTITTFGLDLSLTATGVVCLIDGKLSDSIIFTSKKTDKLPVNELKRIDSLAKNIVSYVKDRATNENCIIAIEGLALYARNTTALVQLAGLNYFVRKGIMFEVLCPFVIVTPTSLKKYVTGKGNAKKNSMFLEVYKRWGESFDDDNLADAYGLAKIATALISEIPEDLTKPQLEVIDLIKKQLT
jgi:crossover junction endodeoxyribonuclease RuvC